jgi:glycosyltransferase involved in cell wall biosynthesis
MPILMIGYEKEALKTDSEAFARIQAYATPDFSIETLALSRGFAADTVAVGEGLAAYGFSGGSLARIWKAFSQGRTSLQKEPKQSIISAQDPFLAGLIAYALHRSTGVPYEIQEHGDFFSPLWKKAHWMNGIWWAVGAFLLRRAAHVRVVSERVRGHVEALGVSLSHITVLPVAQPLADLQARPLSPRDTTQPFRFVMPCRWTYQKGIDIAFQACAELKRRNILFSLTLIGRGELAAEVKEWVKTYKLENTVHFSPWMPASEVWNEADGLIVASRWEGWCRAIPEAMAAGVSVITTPVGCVGSFFRPNQDGLEVPLEEPTQLAEAMEKLCQDETLREQLRVSAREQSYKIADPTQLRATQQDLWRKMIL